MRTIWLAAAAVSLLAACDGTPEPGSKPKTPETSATTNAKVDPVPTETAKASAPEGGDTCGADKIKPFIGRQDRPTTRADLVKAVGHDKIRWLGPDDAATMDYSAERLNVLLDATKRLITGARCG